MTVTSPTPRRAVRGTDGPPGTVGPLGLPAAAGRSDERTDARGGVASNRPAPFEAVLDAHGAEIYRYLRRLARNAEDAADLHQETFLRAFRAYERLDAGANVRAWLYRIAGNLAIDAQRRRHSPDVPDESLAAPARAGDPAAAARASALRAAVRAALLRLSPTQRLAVSSRVFDEASYEDVAALLGCSETTARQHVSQGLRRLRAALKDWA